MIVLSSTVAAGIEIVEIWITPVVERDYASEAYFPSSGYLALAAW